MTTPRAFTHACALTLPVWVGVASWVDGWLAVGTAIAGLVAVLNVAAAESAVRRWARAVQQGDDPRAGMALVGKQLLTLPLAAALMWFLGAPAVALGWLCLASGTAVHAVVQFLHVHDARMLGALTPRETA